MSKERLLEGGSSRRYRREFKSVGIIEIVFGIASMILEMINVIYYSMYSDGVVQVWAAGIWCGLWFITTGILALASWKRPTQCIIITGLIASIFTIIASIYLFFFEIKTAHWIDHLADRFVITVLFHSFLVIIAVAVFVIGIVHLVYSSRAAVDKERSGADDSDSDE